MSKRLAFASLLALAGSAPLPGFAAPEVGNVTSPVSGIAAAVDPVGTYTVTVQRPAWRFSGSTGQPVTGITSSAGSDGIGAYQEVSFRYHAVVDRTSSIRVYSGRPVVSFTTAYLQSAPNSQPFPNLTTLPSLPYHMGYQDTAESRYDFANPGVQGPWVSYDSGGNTFIVSPAANFMIAADQRSGTSAVSGGIDRAIPNLPGGFTHSTILAIGTGVNQAYDTWGGALAALAGNARPANDSSVELNTLGYWTDHGAAYYNQHIPGLDYEHTYAAMKNELAQKGVPIGYLQLDAWWFLKDYSSGTPPLPPNTPATAGFDKLLVHANVSNPSGKPAGGDGITFGLSGTCGSAVPASAPTGSDGVASTDYHSAGSAGFCVLTATEAATHAKGTVVITNTLSPRPSQHTQLTSSATSCPAGVTPPCVPADGASKLSLTAAVSGPAAALDPLRFDLGGPGCGALTATSTSGSTGLASATYTASRTVGACTVTVTEANGASTAALTIQQVSRAGAGAPAQGAASGGESGPAAAVVGNLVQVSTLDVGVYRFVADPRYLPSGLAGFHQQIGLPFITHSRWLAFDSPYRTQYQVSNDVPVGAGYFNSVLAGTSAGGAVMYEQDWLSGMSRPRQNLTDPEAFMAGMASGAASNGQNLLFSMPQPRHYLDGSRFPNLSSIRVSQDRFDRAKWTSYLYSARLAGALGIWPWTDVFLSSETGNLLLSTLSGGMVGVGDAQGQVNAANLRQTVRPDGVIVKPDAPLEPVDSTFIQDARAGGADGSTAPVVAATFTDHGGGMRGSFVVAYSRGGTSQFSFNPASLGVRGSAYVYDYFSKSGRVVPGGQVFSGSVADLNYYLVAPVGASGIAFLGDAGKFVSLGKKRISQLQDGGSVLASVTFAPGESSTRLFGYAPSRPRVISSSGPAGAVAYSPTTGIFQLTVSPDGQGKETLGLSL